MPSASILPELTALVVAALGQEAAIRATLADVPGLEAAFIGRALPIDEHAGKQRHARSPSS